MIAILLVGLCLVLLQFSGSGPRVRELANEHGHRCYLDNLNTFEAMVVSEISQHLNCREYFIFNNIILPHGDGSTQIDHVIVSPFGLFVLESKDLSGWIFGQQYDETWTQTFRYGRKVIQNPLRQNFAHIKAIAHHTHCDEQFIRGLVVLSDRSSFKSARPKTVLYLNELVPHIRTYVAPVFSNAEFLSIIGTLSYLCQATSISGDQHIRYVQTKMTSRSE